MWNDLLNRYNIESIGSLNLSEISSKSYGNTNLIKVVMIKGYLKDIRKAKANEVNKLISKSELISYNETFLTVELVDDIGSTPVILQSTSLNEEDLKDIRKHYIYCFSENNIYIINFSVQ